MGVQKILKQFGIGDRLVGLPAWKLRGERGVGVLGGHKRKTAINQARESKKITYRYKIGCIFF